MSFARKQKPAFNQPNEYRFRPDKPNEFQFEPPIEAPTFCPSHEEMLDPLVYIAKIREKAEKFGMCKIRPPADWQPPFAVNIKKFKFSARIQKIHELEARTRIKLDFIHKIAKFKELQGSNFSIPMIGGRILDSHALYYLVEKEGGYRAVIKRQKWAEICIKMGLSIQWYNVIKTHYEEVLYPFSIFQGSKVNSTKHPSTSKQVFVESEPADLPSTSSCKQEHPSSTKQICVNSEPLSLPSTSSYKQELPSTSEQTFEKSDCPSLPSTSSLKKEVTIISSDEEESNSLLTECGYRAFPITFTTKIEEDLVMRYADDSLKESLEFAKKFAVSAKETVSSYVSNSTAPSVQQTNIKVEDPEDESQVSEPEVYDVCIVVSSDDEDYNGRATKKIFQRNTEVDVTIVNSDEEDCKQSVIEGDPLAKYICINCGRGDVEESMLLCDGCDDSYHTFCLKPPLADVPKGDWRCPVCVSKEIDKAPEPYGFEQSEKEYTLVEFGVMADRFKADYFGKAVYEVACSEVEKEYWRILSTINSNVTVHYGADIQSKDDGSGFPAKNSPYPCPDPETPIYLKSAWNLNNLPVLSGSVLGFIGGDISGMKVPWMYIGMCFSTFCWHNEDHWSYSINYLHWGEPKTWYAVPGIHADDFERVMKQASPELFAQHPDLLHQLTTTLNPNILQAGGVPVFRTDQEAGDFVITFPRAYHAGFNQGYNCAEAVNFAPSDWLPFGRECIKYYSEIGRNNVFSHDELICKMADNVHRVDPMAAFIAFEDLKIVVRREIELRKEAVKLGIVDHSLFYFECVSDDSRQCDFCKTTCYISGVKCHCRSPKPTISCLEHYKVICKCLPENRKLLYRHTPMELALMLKKLHTKAKMYDKWVSALRTTCHPTPFDQGHQGIQEYAVMII